MKQLIALLSPLFLLASTSLAAAEGPQFTHTKFVEDERSLQSLVEFPDIDFDAKINLRLVGSICMGKPDRTYQRVV